MPLISNLQHRLAAICRVCNFEADCIRHTWLNMWDSKASPLVGCCSYHAATMGAVGAGVAGSLAASRKADVDRICKAQSPSDGCLDTANG